MTATKNPAKELAVRAALRVGELLGKLPEAERPMLAALLDQDDIPPEKVLEVLKAMAKKPAAERREVYRMARSDDAHEREQALAKAAGLPPLPDPAVVNLAEARRRLRTAAKVCRVPALRAPIAEATERVDDLLQRLARETGGHRV